MTTEIIHVKLNRRSVRIFKRFFRLKGFSQNFRIDHTAGKTTEYLVEIRLQHIVSISFHEIYLYFFRNGQTIFLMLPGFGSVQIDISLAPDREMTLVSGIEFCHIRRFGEIKLSDPFLISGITTKSADGHFWTKILL